jgi:hypothetical protein
MGKIVNINETDLKRIVKRVLNERNIINEEPISTLAIIGWSLLAGTALIGGSAGLTWWNGKSASDSVKQLFNGCRSGKIGKPEMSEQQHRDIATRINTAIEGLGTDEDGIADALSEIKSVPDVCEVVKMYRSSGYGDLYRELDGDIDGGEWESVVRVPLSNAINYTKEVNEKAVKGSEPKPGGGGKPSNTNVSGQGSVTDLQQLLTDKGFSVGSNGVDGKFGADTLAATLKALRSLS